MNVLDKIKLFVTRSSPEILPLIANLVPMCFTVSADNGKAALLSEWRICKDHIHLPSRGFEAVANRYSWLLSVEANSVEEKVHCTQACYVWHEINPSESRGS